MDKNIKNIKFVEIDSSLEGTKEFVVTYDYEGKPVKDFIFVNKKAGLKQNDYLKIAKKEFKPNRKTVKGGLKSSPLALKVVAGCALAAAVTLGGLFTWKALTTSNIGDDTYTVTWNLANGSESVKETYHEGEIPKYKGKTPVKANETKLNDDGLQYEYEFEGWLEDIKPVTEDVTYTASYDTKSLYAGIDVFVTQEIIEDSEILGKYDFFFENADSLQINWDYGSGTEDDKIVTENSHTYTTPGLKKIRIYSELNGQVVLSHEDPWLLPLNQSIRRVVIPYYVTKVGWYTDEDTNVFDYWSLTDFEFLEEVALPSDLEEMYAFCYNTYSLNYIKLPQKLKKIHENAFENTRNIKIKVFSEKIEDIDENAFKNVNCFDGISFKSVGTIHKGAFTESHISSLSFDSIDVLNDETTILSIFIDSVIYKVSANYIDKINPYFLNDENHLNDFIVRHIGTIKERAFESPSIDNFCVDEIDLCETRGIRSVNVYNLEINHIKKAVTNAVMVYYNSSCDINTIDELEPSGISIIDGNNKPFYLPIVKNKDVVGLFKDFSSTTIIIPNYYSILTEKFFYNSSFYNATMPKTLTEIRSGALYITDVNVQLDFSSVNVPPTIYADSFSAEDQEGEVSGKMTFLVNKDSYEAYKTSWGAIIPDIVNQIVVA